MPGRAVRDLRYAIDGELRQISAEWGTIAARLHHRNGTKKTFSKKNEIHFLKQNTAGSPQSKENSKEVDSTCDYVTGPGATDIRRGLYDAHELEGRGAYARYPLAFRSEAV